MPACLSPLHIQVRPGRCWGGSVRASALAALPAEHPSVGQPGAL